MASTPASHQQAEHHGPAGARLPATRRVRLYWRCGQSLAAGISEVTVVQAKDAGGGRCVIGLRFAHKPGN